MELYCDISFVSLQMNTSTDFNVTADDDEFVVLYAALEMMGSASTDKKKVGNDIRVLLDTLLTYKDQFPKPHNGMMRVLFQVMTLIWVLCVMLSPLLWCMSNICTMKKL
jgi:hypothetical protein